MIICICNNISEDDIEDNPELIEECGTGCGKCLEYIEENEDEI